MTDIVSWVATIATILAASLTASNLGARITGYGFIVFTIGSIAWLTLGQLTGQPALVYTNIVMTALNLFGVWRWLGRQAKYEDGASRAAATSASLASESLFPASLFTSAQVVGRDGAGIGHCVDAMIGCQSGRVRYIVVSSGGAAGVGERLHRLEWSQARVNDDEVETRLDEPDLSACPRISSDQWPAR